MESFEFHKYSRFASIHGDYKKGWSFTHNGETTRIPSRYAFKLLLGFCKGWLGAGYIGGVTLFFARNSDSRNWQLRFRGRADRRAPLGFEIGYTRNGNKVPYVSH